MRKSQKHLKISEIEQKIDGLKTVNSETVEDLPNKNSVNPTIDKVNPKDFQSSKFFIQRQADHVGDRSTGPNIHGPPSDTDKILSEEEKIKQILDKSIVVEETETDSIGKDMLGIAKEYTDPKNRFLFGHTSEHFIFEDSVLGAYIETIKNDPSMVDLYTFLKNFRFHYHTGRSAIKAKLRNDFTEFGSAILAFRGALEWREAGVRAEAKDREKETLREKIKR